MTSIERIEGLEINEFIRLYEQEGPFEIINGEYIPLSPTRRTHSLITRILFRALDSYCSDKKLGEVFSETTFVISDIKDWVKGSRQPDVMFVSNVRYAAAHVDLPGEAEKPFIFVPDLVAKIISPTDRTINVLNKVSAYLEDGVQTVWVIERERRIVMVYQMDGIQWLTVNDLLDGGAVIPGFTLPVAALFE